MTTMLAVRANSATDVQLEKVAAPEPGPQDVLVRVAAAGLAPGILGMLARGAFRHLPTTLGHEIAGTVVAVGEDVDTGLVGARVRVHPNLTCRACRYCSNDREQMCLDAAVIGLGALGTGAMPLYERYHDGGLAELVRVPSWLIDVLPDNVGFEVGAKVHELAIAVRALKLAELRPGSTLVVTAATGAMGTATVRLAPLFGVGSLILVGRSAERLDAVRDLAQVQVDTVALDELGPDWGEAGALTGRLRGLVTSGADAVIDYLSSGPGTTQALASLTVGGTLVHIGGNPAPVALPIAALLGNCWRVVGNRACTRNDALEVIELLRSGALQADDLITHRYPLDAIHDAFAAVRDRPEPMWMSVVQP